MLSEATDEELAEMWLGALRTSSSTATEKHFGESEIRLLYKLLTRECIGTLDGLMIHFEDSKN